MPRLKKQSYETIKMKKKISQRSKRAQKVNAKLLLEAQPSVLTANHKQIQNCFVNMNLRNEMVDPCQLGEQETSDEDFFSVESPKTQQVEDTNMKTKEKRITRSRTTKKFTKKARKEIDVNESSDSGNEKKKQLRSGKTKKLRGSSSKNMLNPDTKKMENRTIRSKQFATGSFVVSKKDAQVGDPHKHPAIWRVDGKSLLQKYEPFDHEGKIRHKTTAVYTGWSPLDIDTYAPVTVDLIQQSAGQNIVELHWDELKSIIHDDSD